MQLNLLGKQQMVLNLKVASCPDFPKSRIYPLSQKILVRVIVQQPRLLTDLVLEMQNLQLCYIKKILNLTYHLLLRLFRQSSLQMQGIHLFHIIKKTLLICHLLLFLHEKFRKSECSLPSNDKTVSKGRCYENHLLTNFERDIQEF